MQKLTSFISLLTGEFDNAKQLAELEQQGIGNFPYARHVNTVCNDKILDLPSDFSGIFMVEESYYTTNGSTHASSHLFLFTQVDDGIELASYELPEGYRKTDFTYQALAPVSYSQVKKSEKFTPALYTFSQGVWSGGSVSMFSPVLKFTLYERFSADCLEVSETMEVNGKRTFGYDIPIIYRRSQK